MTPAAKVKSGRKRSTKGSPVDSLLERLGSPALNHVTLAQDNQHEFRRVAQSMALQAEAFALLRVNRDKIVSRKVTGWFRSRN